MEKFAHRFEAMLRDLLLVYKDLKKKFEQEKKFIMDMDVDSIWKITHQKRQFALKIEQTRENILSLLEENNVLLDRELRPFSLSHIINSLAFPVRVKSDLKKIKVELDMVKSELASMASENKRYVNEYLSVIDGVFATIIGSDNKEKYNKAGRILKDKTQKYLIRAEV